MSNATGTHAGSVVERLARALLALPARRQMVLRPTPAGIMVFPVGATVAGRVDAAPLDDDPLADSSAVGIAPASTPLLLVSPASDAGSPADAAADPMRRLRAADAALEQRPAAEHAMALLNHLQADSDTIGAVDYEIVECAYADVLIELGWAPIRWQTVATHLRALTGSRKRYVNRNGGKVLVYDIPDPHADELAEHYERVYAEAA